MRGGEPATKPGAYVQYTVVAADGKRMYCFIHGLGTVVVQLIKFCQLRFVQRAIAMQTTLA